MPTYLERGLINLQRLGISAPPEHKRWAWQLFSQEVLIFKFTRVKKHVQTSKHAETASINHNLQL